MSYGLIVDLEGNHEQGMGIILLSTLLKRIVKLQLVLLAIFKDLTLIISLRCQHLIKVQVLFQDFLNEEATCRDISGINKKCPYECFESVSEQVGRCDC